MKRTAEDKRWSAEVRARDGWSCRKCGRYFPEGRRGGLDGHHIFTRGRGSTKLEVENGVALCFGDHMWAHANPLEFHEWIKAELGAEAYDALQQRSRVLKRTGT
jgi:hypothetical protein